MLKVCRAKKGIAGYFPQLRKGNLRHEFQITPPLSFTAKRERKPFKRDKSTSRDLLIPYGI